MPMYSDDCPFPNQISKCDNELGFSDGSDLVVSGDEISFHGSVHGHELGAGCGDLFELKEQTIKGRRR
jgi:hypothetical protein